MLFKPAFRSVILLCLGLLLGSAPMAASGQAGPERLPVGSPIHLRFEYPCTDLASIQVVLDDEVKDIIARQILLPDCDGKDTGSYDGKVYWDPFERLTPAHLSVAGYDPQTRLSWVQSLNIQFTDAAGPTEIVLELDNPIRIESPAQGEVLAGSQVAVSGSLAVSNLNPLNFELVSDDGRIIAAGVFQIPAGAMGQTIPYAVTLPILDRRPTQARLSVMQFGQDIFGIESIQSVYLTLP